MMETKNPTSELNQEQSKQEAVEAWMSKLIEENTSMPSIVRCLKAIQEDMHAPGIRTGFPQLDAMLGDGLCAELYVLGGSDASTGGTGNAERRALCLQIADQIAKDGHSVVFLSMTRPSDELIAQSFSRLSFFADIAAGNQGVNAKTPLEILHGRHYHTFSENELSLIRQAVGTYCDEYAKNICFVEGTNGSDLEVAERAVAEYSAMADKAPVLIVDDLQNLVRSYGQLPNAQGIDAVMAALKRLSLKFRTPVIAISNANEDDKAIIRAGRDIFLGMQYAWDMLPYTKDISLRPVKIQYMDAMNLVQSSAILYLHKQYCCYLSSKDQLFSHD